MPEPATQRYRLRFVGLEHESFQDGSCRVRVGLEWYDRHVTGEARGMETREGVLRSAALATLQGIREHTGGALDLELAGVKAVRAFDAWVVIAALRGPDEDRARPLLGSLAATDDDTARGAVLAVLNATNRIVEQYLPQRDGA